MMTRQQQVNMRSQNPATQYAISAVIGIANIMSRKSARRQDTLLESRLICFATDVAVASCGGGWLRLPPPRP